MNVNKQYNRRRCSAAELCKFWYVIFLLIFFAGCKTSQAPLLDNTSDKFETSPIKKDPDEIYPYYSLLGYHTFQSSASTIKADSTITNLGLILPGEHLENETINGNVLFGNNDDVSIINYSVKLQRKYEGRSALLSVLNLFAKEQDKTEQKPYDVLQAVYINGTMHTGDRITTFSFERKQHSPLKGWLCYNNDTLFLQQIKKQSLQLVSKDSIYAAIDFHRKSYTIYMLNGIDNNKRLIAASYFFVFAAYEYNLGTDPAEQHRDRHD